MVCKFRTLHVSFDREGQPNPNGDDRSWIGNFLRRTRIDELPQLLNVCCRKISRPIAICVCWSAPGITGWAQINGGNLITTEEKGALDDWYIQITGERRFEQPIRDADVAAEGQWSVEDIRRAQTV